MIRYQVGFEQANAHLFDVKLNINFALHKGQQFYLPDWIPGSYMIRDFSKNIVSLKANSKGKSVSIEKISKSCWQLLNDVECLEILYQVYAWDLSVRSAHLDNQHAFFNGTSLFLAIDGYESEQHKVLISASSIAQKNNWQLATAMPSIAIDSAGFGKYESQSYEEVIDHPFEIANFQSLEFIVNKTVHKMVFTEAPADVDWSRVSKDVQKICETEIQFFGDEQPPFNYYLFMTFVLKNGFGGLEHRASTALHCSADDLPRIGENPEVVDHNYRRFLSLCCHEYFHNWNVKRIKPARFLSMRLNKETHTELLWFFEGITSYYDELLMVRSGVIDTKTYLDMLAQTLTRTYRSKGRHNQTVAESSFDAWTKFYKQDENAVNAIVSYYAKGALIAFALDMEIRNRTEEKSSLDDLMRLVWRQHGKIEKGVGETQIQQIVRELVGESMSEFFREALYSTADLPLDKYFKHLGIEFQLLPQILQSEKGGFIEKAKQRTPLSFLGLTHKKHAVGAEVVSVVTGSCASEAGLSNGDIIIAIDNEQISSTELDQMVSKLPIGREVTIHYFRRAKLYLTTCVLQEADANTVYLSFDLQNPTSQMLNWIEGSGNKEKVKKA